MDTTLVLTIIGADRPGIVDALSALVADHGGSWQRSRMARLAGQFAGILEVSVPSAGRAALREALGALAAQGLTVHVADSAEGEAGATARRLGIRVIGHDRPGIVRRIAAALAADGANVVELESRCAPAPMTGVRMFEASALVELPAGLEPEDLRGRLEALAGDMMVDLGVEEA